MEIEFTSELVDKYARDLLFELTDEENKNVLDEFEVIKENMDLISQMEGLSEVEAMTHPLEYEDVVLREDTISDELLVDEVLSNAKEKTLEEVIVPKVVE